MKHGADRRRAHAAVVACLMLAVGGGCGGPVIPTCFLGKDFSVAESARDLRRLPADTIDLRIRGLSDPDAGEIARFSGLQEIDFYCGIAVLEMRMTAIGFRTIAQQAHPKLRAVLIDRAPRFDDDCLESVCSFPSIRELIVRRSPAFTRQGLRHALDLGQLESLDIRGCAQIDDTWIDLLSEFRTLRRLHVTETSLTPEGVARLRERLPGCEIDDSARHWAWSKS